MRPWARADWACLGAVLLAAAALRFYGIAYGLPRVVYVDSFMYVGEAVRILEPGAYVPREFYYPSAYIDLLAGIYWLLDIETTYAHHLTARVVATIFNLLLITLVYVVVRRGSSTRGALIAATLTAVCPTILTSARVETTDVALVFFMTAALVLAYGFPTRFRYWPVIGILAGLAAATKYSGVFVLPFVALAAATVAWRTGSWKQPALGVACAVVCAAAVFSATTPWFFTYFGEFASWFETQLLAQRSGQIGRVQATAWDYLVSPTPTWEQPWLGTSLLWNFGPPLFVAALAAWLWAILGYGGTRRRYEALFVFLFVGASCGAGRLKAIRYLMPALPCLFILVGCGADRLLQMLPRRWALERWAAPTLLALLAAHPATVALRYVAASAAPMTNELARAWLSANVAPGARVFASPLFVDDLHDLPFRFAYIPGAGQRQYRLPEGKGPSAERSPIYQAALVDELRRHQVEYVVLNSWFNDAFSPVPENLLWFPQSVAGYREFMGRLESSSTLRWRVGGYAEGRLGPAIEIYQFN